MSLILEIHHALCLIHHDYLLVAMQKCFLKRCTGALEYYLLIFFGYILQPKIQKVPLTCQFIYFKDLPIYKYLSVLHVFSGCSFSTVVSELLIHEYCF